MHLLSFLQIAEGYGRHTLELAASNCFYYTLLWSEELEVEREKQRKEGPKLVTVSRVVVNLAMRMDPQLLPGLYELSSRTSTTDQWLAECTRPWFFMPHNSMDSARPSKASLSPRPSLLLQLVSGSTFERVIQQ